MYTATAVTDGNGRYRISQEWDPRVGETGFFSTKNFDNTHFYVRNRSLVYDFAEGDKNMRALKIRMIEFMEKMQIRIDVPVSLMFDTSEPAIIRLEERQSVLQQKITHHEKLLEQRKAELSGFVRNQYIRQYEGTLSELRKELRNVEGFIGECKIRRWSCRQFMAMQVSKNGNQYKVIIGIGSGNIYYSRYDYSDGKWVTYRSMSLMLKNQ